MDPGSARGSLTSPPDWSELDFLGEYDKARIVVRNLEPCVALPTPVAAYSHHNLRLNSQRGKPHPAGGSAMQAFRPGNPWRDIFEYGTDSVR
jgi:hypothetical protein